MSGLDIQSLLTQILTSVNSLQIDQKALASSVDAINGRVNALAGVKSLNDAAAAAAAEEQAKSKASSSSQATKVNTDASALSLGDTGAVPPASPTEETQVRKASSVTSRIILTTYPGQSGIEPVIMNWGHKDPATRGPVVVSRHTSTVRKRNGMVCLLSSLASYRTCPI